MPLSRREFIRQMGIAFASLALTQCKRQNRGRSNPPVTCYTVVPSPTPDATPGAMVTCYTPAPLPTPTPELTMVVECYEAAPMPTETPGGQVGRTEVLTDVVDGGDVDPKTARRVQAADARERLRACWLGLDELAQQAQQDVDASQEARDALVDTHSAVLDELVLLDELGAAVAVLVQGAFEEGAYHVWRMNVPVTCYIATPIQYEPRQDLVARAEALSGIAGGGAGDVDPDVVAKAQAALARDIAFFEALDPDEPADTALLAEWESQDIEASADVIKAARFLGTLLSGSEGVG